MSDSASDSRPSDRPGAYLPLLGSDTTYNDEAIRTDRKRKEPVVPRQGLLRELAAADS